MEWLELKDKDFSYSRPNMICNFLYEKEEETAESAQETTEDKLTEEPEGEAHGEGSTDQASDPEMQPSVEMDESVCLLDTTNSEAMDSSSMNTQDINSDDSSH